MPFYDTAIILNQQSLDKFEQRLKPGGLLLYDTNGITRHPQRKDLKIYTVEAAKEAARMGSTRTFNMIVLGAYLKLKPVLELKNIMSGLKASLPERHHHLIPMNHDAILRGMEIVSSAN